METGHIALADDYNHNSVTHYKVDRLPWNKKSRERTDELMEIKKFMIKKKNLQNTNEAKAI